MEVQFSDSRFPDEVVRALDIRIGCYYQLNELSQVCTGFQEHDFAKLGAVCHLAKPEGIESVRQLAENLDQFDFAPDVHTPEEYGQYMIQQSGRYEYDENLAEFYNYEEYGIKRIFAPIPKTDLPGKIPLAAENDISLYWEIDNLTQYHGYHISAKIRQTTMFCVIAQNVPFEGCSQHSHFDSRPAKIHLGHICKSSRQELQQYVLKHRNEVALQFTVFKYILLQFLPAACNLQGGFWLAGNRSDLMLGATFNWKHFGYDATWWFALFLRLYDGP